MKISLITLANGNVEGHRAGCQDVARKAKAQRAEVWTFEAASKHAAFLDYNSDFIAEGTDEADCYPITWLPCSNELA